MSTSDHFGLRHYQVQAMAHCELAIDAPFRSLSDRPSPAKPQAPRSIVYAKAKAKERAA